MAVNWDEERINAMYRQYRMSRDGIPWYRYQPILDAAREMTERVESERHIAEILQKAGEMYPPLEQSGVVNMADARRRKRNSPPGNTMASRLKNSLSSLQENLSPARWVPLAAAAAVVLAVAPLVIQQDGAGTGADLVAQQTGILQQNAGKVSSQLESLLDTQYGFASSGSAFSEAFRAGTLFVDLISLSRDPANPQVARVVDAVMADMGEKADIEAPEQLDADALTRIGDRLQAYYSRSSQSSVFVFGQWVESTFLLAGVVDAEQAAPFVDALGAARDISELLETGGYLTESLEKDLGNLEALGRSGELDPTTLQRASGLLLKLRTQYAGA